MDSEYADRLRAVELDEAGWKTGAIAQEVGRSGRWVRKWIGRFETEGESGLVDRSRRPACSPNRLSDTVRGEVLKTRAELGEDRHANVGAKAIRARMRRVGLVDEVPSESSIKRILRDAGVTPDVSHQTPIGRIGPRAADHRGGRDLAASRLGPRPVLVGWDQISVAADL